MGDVVLKLVDGSRDKVQPRMQGNHRKAVRKRDVAGDTQFMRREFDRLIERIEAEGQRFGVLLGFKRGPKMLHAIEREIEYWEDKGQSIEYVPDGTPECNRFMCLDALDMLLQPAHFGEGQGAGVGYECDWFAEYHTLLCHFASKACPAPDAASFAEWSRSKREGIADKVSKLQSELDEEQQHLDGLRS